MDDIYSGKPWLKFYDQGIPHEIEYPCISYAEFIRDAFDKFPDRVALYYMGKGIKYRELDILSNQFARFLLQNACHSGDVIGVHLPNIPACYISCLGIQKAGCVYSGVSALLTPDELIHQLNDSGAKIVVTLDLLFETLAKAIGYTGVHTVVVASVADFLPPIKKIVGKLLKKIPSKDTEDLAGVRVVRFKDGLKDMNKDIPEVKIEPDKPSFIMYTGGTTGRPKGAVLTHNNFVRHLVQINTWLGLSMGQHTTLCPYPLFHVAGCFIAMGCIALGNSLILIPNPRDLMFMVSAIKKHRPTSVLAVPTLYLALMKLPGFRALDFSGIQYFLSGSAPFPQENLREFEELVKGRLIETYGLTESVSVVAAPPYNGVKKTGSVGIPIMDTEVKIVDPETGDPVPAGEPGEIIVKGPQVFAGYYNQPEETAYAVRNGWLHTGDIARMDDDGYFYIVDRLKDMVNVSGFKVFTRVVDEVLVEHPDVEMGATIGLPDPNRPGSEIVAAAVVLKTGRQKNEDMKREITAHMEKKLSAYKIPKLIEFMDQLPLSPVGKVLKRDLRKIMESRPD